MSSTTRGAREDHDLGRVVEAAVRGALNYRGPLDDGTALGRALAASYVVERDEPWARHEGAPPAEAGTARPRAGSDGAAPRGRPDAARVRFVPSATVGAAMGGTGVPVGPMARYRDDAQQVRARVTHLLQSVRLDPCCSGAAAELVPQVAQRIRGALDTIVTELAGVPLSRLRVRRTVEALVGRDGASGLAATLADAVSRATQELPPLERLALLDAVQQVGEELRRLHAPLANGTSRGSSEDYYAKTRPEMSLLLDATAGDVAELRRLLQEHGLDDAAARLVHLSTTDEDIALDSALGWLEHLAVHAGPTALDGRPEVVRRELEPALEALQGAMSSLAGRKECPFDDGAVRCVVERLRDRVADLSQLLRQAPSGRSRGGGSSRGRSSRSGSPGDQGSRARVQRAPSKPVLEVVFTAPQDEQRTPRLHVWGDATRTSTSWPDRLKKPDRISRRGHGKEFVFRVPLSDPQAELGLEVHYGDAPAARKEPFVPADELNVRLSAPSVPPATS